MRTLRYVPRASLSRRGQHPAPGCPARMWRGRWARKGVRRRGRRQEQTVRQSARAEESPMIEDIDADFHAPTSDDPPWAETNYFGLYIPDTGPVERRRLRAVPPERRRRISTIAVNSRFVAGALARRLLGRAGPPPHPPAAEPARLRFANGLHVSAPTPTGCGMSSLDPGTRLDWPSATPRCRPLRHQRPQAGPDLASRPPTACSRGATPTPATSIRPATSRAR